jgi:hypothetical protein
MRPRRALDILKDSLGLLARVAGTARNRPEADAVNSVGARCVLGLSILAIGEAQAALVLLSAGLDRPGRVHLRSLYEYGVRADLVSGDPQTAQRFLAAAAHEAKRLGTDMGLAPDRIQQVIDAYTIPGVATGREADALGGSMKAIVRAQTAVAKYAMYFAWPSLMSHGSILALHEVSRAIAGSGANFPAAAVTDGTGNAKSATGCGCGSLAHVQALQSVRNRTPRTGASEPHTTGRCGPKPSISKHPEAKRNSWDWRPP